MRCMCRTTAMRRSWQFTYSLDVMTTSGACTKLITHSTHDSPVGVKIYFVLCTRRFGSEIVDRRFMQAYLLNSLDVS